MNLWPQSTIVISLDGFACGHGRLDICRHRTLSSCIVHKGDEEDERREIHLHQWEVKLID